MLWKVRRVQSRSTSRQTPIAAAVCLASIAPARSPAGACHQVSGDHDLVVHRRCARRRHSGGGGQLAVTPVVDLASQMNLAAGRGHLDIVVIQSRAVQGMADVVGNRQTVDMPLDRDLIGNAFHPQQWAHIPCGAGAGCHCDTAGQRVTPARYDAFAETHFILSGTAAVRQEDTVTHLGRLEGVRFEPGTSHSVRNTGEQTLYLLRAHEKPTE